MDSKRAIIQTCFGARRLAPAGQSGAALIVCLLMLVVVLMLGTSAAQIALQEEKASRMERDRQLALESAEAALGDAELDIESSPRRHVFSSAESFSQECGEGAGSQYLGLCLPATSRGMPVWQRVNLASKDEGSTSVPFGHFTGRKLQTGDGLLPAAPPRYIIELIPYSRKDSQSGLEEPPYLYRITALGFGLRATTTVVLQTFYRKASGESVDSRIPKGRLSWREIPNWKELHDASEKG